MCNSTVSLTDVKAQHKLWPCPREIRKWVAVSWILLSLPRHAGCILLWGWKSFSLVQQAAAYAQGWKTMDPALCSPGVGTGQTLNCNAQRMRFYLALMKAEQAWARCSRCTIPDREPFFWLPWVLDQVTKTEAWSKSELPHHSDLHQDSSHKKNNLEIFLSLSSPCGSPSLESQ